MGSQDQANRTHWEQVMKIQQEIRVSKNTRRRLSTNLMCSESTNSTFVVSFICSAELYLYHIFLICVDIDKQFFWNNTTTYFIEYKTHNKIKQL
jgi:hypothetical protein